MPLSDNTHAAPHGDDRPAEVPIQKDLAAMAATRPRPDDAAVDSTVAQRPAPEPEPQLVLVRSSLRSDLVVSPAVRQLATTIARCQVSRIDLRGVIAAQAIAESVAAQIRPLLPVLEQLQRTVHASLWPALAACQQFQNARLLQIAQALTVRIDRAPILMVCKQLSEELARRLRVVFQGWRVAELAGGLLRNIGLWGLAAARRARDAVVRGDEDELLVFIEGWLGLDPTPTVIEAVSMVLLTEDWLASGPVDPDEARKVLGWLRRRAIAEHRVHKPVWMTQVRGRRIRLLEQPVALGHGRFADLSDLLADPRSAVPFVAVEGDYTDVRLARLLGRLTPQERAVVDAYAAGAPSWAQAARAAGLPTAFGDVVRRRARHHRDRVAAQLPTLERLRPFDGIDGR